MMTAQSLNICKIKWKFSNLRHYLQIGYKFLDKMPGKY